MKAYSDNDLHNLYLREQLSEAYSNGCITAEQHKELHESATVNLYTPNIFIRIGLALLTIVIVSFSAGLVALLTDGGGAPSVFSIMLGGFSYGALELLLSAKKHYNSGVDNILLIATVLFIVTGVAIAFHDLNTGANTAMYFTACIVCSYLCYRFTDALMGAAAVVSLVMLSIVLFSSFLPIPIAHLPALLVCFLIYRYANKIANNDSSIIYHSVFRSVALTALILFYLCGNILVIHEISSELTGNAGAIYFVSNIFYWTWTMLMPVVYISFGIRKRDIVLIRTGVLLVAVAVMTFRYYHSVMSVEAAMIIAGGLSLIISYFLIQYLRTPKHGFTFQPEAKAHSELDVEDLVTERVVNRAGGM